MIVQFTVPGPPQPKPRPRVTRRGTYTPAAYAAWERGAKLIAQSVMHGDPPLAGPIMLSVVAYLPVPKRWTKKKKADLPLHSSRPDLDNIVKAVQDVCNGVVFNDDGQVYSLAASKLYSDQPQVIVSAKETRP